MEPAPHTSRTVLGHSVTRLEDVTLLTGEARFLADLPSEPGELHAAFVRSPVAHGVIRRIDIDGVIGGPGVRGSWTAATLPLADHPAFGGQPELSRPLLARDRVRFVGEPVAVVVAETAAAAFDALAEAIVDIEPLPPVVDPEVAARAGAPLLFPEYGSNVIGDAAAEPADDFFADADVVVRARLRHQRVAPVTMEPNGARAVPEADGSLSVWVSTQSVFHVRGEIARALDVAPDRVRVRAPWVGGGFGAKGGTYPEQIITAALAHRLACPVRWVETRVENFVVMTHGRGQLHEVELGATRDGRMTALRVRGYADVGAYPSRGMFIPMVTGIMASGVYATPKIDYAVVPVVTNTTPTGPYRGAGRPEAAALVERAVDVLATELGLDPVEVRRRNFVSPSAFPFTTATGATYDSGDYERSLDEALALADYRALRAEQQRRRRDPNAALLGIGVACYVEMSGMGGEFGSVAVEDNGTVTVVTGSVPHGQGHETVWAQIASAVLGVPFDAVRVVHSDTARVDHGTGTFGSRSLQLAGSAVHDAATEVLTRARELAAELLEAAPEDITVLDGGRLGVAGAPVSGLAWSEIAAEASRRNVVLAHELDFQQLAGSFPSGCHIATVEIDRETGGVALRSVVAVDDCGVVINPLLAEGQVHGGLAQGIAQILFEGVRYDDDGNPLTTTLADYLVPAASELPSFLTARTVTRGPNNPLGAKGIGEGGTTGSMAAVWNAVVDALAPFGVTDIDPPCRPEVVWSLMQR